jgi:hypothetical protein
MTDRREMKNMERREFTNMKNDTMQRLMALPKASQEKVWKLAMDRLKMAKTQKNEALRSQDKQTKK